MIILAIFTLALCLTDIVLISHMLVYQEIVFRKDWYRWIVLGGVVLITFLFFLFFGLQYLG